MNYFTLLRTIVRYASVCFTFIDITRTILTYVLPRLRSRT
jgi:hypothetical protein